MKVLITGAGGFIGRALGERLVSQGSIGEGHVPCEQLILCDARADGIVNDPRVRAVIGDLSDPPTVSDALKDDPEVVFHLAAVPGGAAEADYDLGKRVNLDATMRLIDRLRNRPNQPRLIVSSSIAVFGSPLPAVVDDNTPPSPALSYGAQKLMTEIYLADLVRRGEIDARCVRLPGIVARPRQAGGHISAYMSNVFHAVAAGEKFVCPVSPTAVAWFMSVTCVVDNLLHAARLTPPRDKCVWTLPALILTMQDLVAAIGRVTGRDAGALVSYQPDEAIEAQFGRYPPLKTPQAEALGFCHDGDAATLVRRALNHASIGIRKDSQKSA